MAVVGTDIVGLASDPLPAAVVAAAEVPLAVFQGFAVGQDQCLGLGQGALALVPGLALVLVPSCLHQVPV